MTSVSTPAHRARASRRVAAVVIAFDAAPKLAGVIDELRRESIEVALGSSEVLAQPPRRGTVYVLWCGGGLPRELARQAASWAGDDPRPGLVAVVHARAADAVEAAFGVGFDDVVVAPVSHRELAARIRSVHRRIHWAADGAVTRLRVGDLVLDTERRMVWHGEAPIDLTPAEYAVMLQLMRAKGRAISREELLEQMGARAAVVHERAVDNVIFRLRHKLPRPDLIETVRGVGFRIAR